MAFPARRSCRARSSYGSAGGASKRRFVVSTEATIGTRSGRRSSARFWERRCGRSNAGGDLAVRVPEAGQAASGAGTDATRHDPAARHGHGGAADVDGTWSAQRGGRRTRGRVEAPVGDQLAPRGDRPPSRPALVCGHRRARHDESGARVTAIRAGIRSGIATLSCAGRRAGLEVDSLRRASEIGWQSRPGSRNGPGMDMCAPA